ncbi:MAG: MarR family transcriptional regulator [Planctomycetes bacterium]|nr:MarR family transcriptional regulator [Planctomycetota bacterium]
MSPRKSKTAASPVPRVADEIQQTRPFRSSAQEALLALILTSDRVLARTATELARVADITPQQYNVLRILRGAGPEGLPTLAIADRMIERTPGITRLLDRLERKGWIERERLADDRRQVLCRATKTALKLLAKLDPLMDELDDLPGRELNGAETKQLIALLDRVRAAFA